MRGATGRDRHQPTEEDPRVEWVPPTETEEINQNHESEVDGENLEGNLEENNQDTPPRTPRPIMPRLSPQAMEQLLPTPVLEPARSTSPENQEAINNGNATGSNIRPRANVNNNAESRERATIFPEEAAHRKGCVGKPPAY